jgi:hypothetical protein
MAKRTAEVIRGERDVVAAQIERLRAKQRALSNELREVEGPIPDRSHRPKGAGFTIKAVAE